MQSNQLGRSLKNLHHNIVTVRNNSCHTHTHTKRWFHLNSLWTIR